ncbi:hypothetical protein BKA82DRAFT_4461270 [Pisolithus tinctorius]|nr:hypothetical protein BKA82DRAFT_4461270 [Pisolithus tinctorius]
MTLTAITAPAEGKKPGRCDIITVDLKSKEDRIANVRHLINLSPLLPLLANLVPSGVNDFRDAHERPYSGDSTPASTNTEKQRVDELAQVRPLQQLERELIKYTCITANTKTSQGWKIQYGTSFVYAFERFAASGVGMEIFTAEEIWLTVRERYALLLTSLYIRNHAYAPSQILEYNAGVMPFSWLSHTYVFNRLDIPHGCR